jgi:hypothetical protein
MRFTFAIPSYRDARDRDRGGDYPAVGTRRRSEVARTAVFAVRGSSFEKSAGHGSGGPRYQLWQPRFFDRALRTVKEYNEKVECIHLNPVKAGLISRPEDWRWSSYNEYAGMSAEEQKKRCGLIVDRVRIPSDFGARI